MKSPASRRHIRLWLLIAAGFTLLLSLTVGAIVLSYRLSLEDRYEEGLRRQLSKGLDQLLASEDPAQAAQSLESQGIYALLVGSADRQILYHGSGGPPLSLGPKRENGQKQARNPWVEDAALLEEIVTGQLGREDGSFFAAVNLVSRSGEEIDPDGEGINLRFYREAYADVRVSLAPVSNGTIVETKGVWDEHGYWTVQYQEEGTYFILQ